MRGGELVGISGLAELLDFLQFGFAQLKKAALEFRIEHGCFLPDKGRKPKREVYPLSGWACMLDGSFHGIQ